MADIVIKSNDEDVTLNFEFYTTQQFFYNVAVVNKNDDKQIFHGSGSSDGIKEFSLGKANDLLGCELTIYWTIADPVGAGNTFSAEAVVKQNLIVCSKSQLCSGKTKANQSFYANIGTFIKCEE